MRPMLAILITTAWLTLLPDAAGAQAPALQVRIVDMRGAGVPGVTIALRDAGGAQPLAEQATDVAGEARFAALATTTVRLSLRGTTAGGAAIVLGESSFIDAPAILIRSDIGGPLVALVMADDGQVYLDPAALELEGGPSPTRAAAATASAPSATAAVEPMVAAAPTRHAPVAPAVPLWALVLIGVALTGGAVAISLRWGTRS